MNKKLRILFCMLLSIIAICALAIVGCSDDETETSSSSSSSSSTISSDDSSSSTSSSSSEEETPTTPTHTHTYGDPVWTWTAGAASYEASVSITCTDNDSTLTASGSDVTVTYTETTAPTDSTDGAGTFTATLNGSTVTNTKDVTVKYLNAITFENSDGTDTSYYSGNNVLIAPVSGYYTFTISGYDTDTDLSVYYGDNDRTSLTSTTTTISYGFSAGDSLPLFALAGSCTVTITYIADTALNAEVTNTAGTSADDPLIVYSMTYYYASNTYTVESGDVVYIRVDAASYEDTEATLYITGSATYTVTSCDTADGTYTAATATTEGEYAINVNSSEHLYIQIAATADGYLNVLVEPTSTESYELLSSSTNDSWYLEGGSYFTGYPEYTYKVAETGTYTFEIDSNGDILIENNNTESYFYGNGSGVELYDGYDLTTVTTTLTEGEILTITSYSETTLDVFAGTVTITATIESTGLEATSFTGSNEYLSGAIYRITVADDAAGRYTFTLATSTAHPTDGLLTVVTKNKTLTLYSGEAKNFTLVAGETVKVYAYYDCTLTVTVKEPTPTTAFNGDVYNVSDVTLSSISDGTVIFTDSDGDTVLAANGGSLTYNTPTEIEEDSNMTLYEGVSLTSRTYSSNSARGWKLTLASDSIVTFYYGISSTAQTFVVADSNGDTVATFGTTNGDSTYVLSYTVTLSAGDYTIMPSGGSYVNFSLYALAIKTITTSVPASLVIGDNSVELTATDADQGKMSDVYTLDAGTYTFSVSSTADAYMSIKVYTGDDTVAYDLGGSYGSYVNVTVYDSSTIYVKYYSNSYPGVATSYVLHIAPLVEVNITTLVTEGTVLQDDGSYSSDVTLYTGTDGTTVVATASSEATISVDDNSKSADGYSFSYRLKLGGAGSEDARSLAITTTGACTITVYMMSSSGSTDRTVALYTYDATAEEGSEFTAYSEAQTVGGSSLTAYTYTVSEAGTYYLAAATGGTNVYGIVITYTAE